MTDTTKSRNNRIFVYLTDNEELEFVRNLARISGNSMSGIIRGWVHEKYVEFQEKTENGGSVMEETAGLVNKEEKKSKEKKQKSQPTR